MGNKRVFLLVVCINFVLVLVEGKCVFRKSSIEVNGYYNWFYVFIGNGFFYYYFFLVCDCFLVYGFVKKKKL